MEGHASREFRRVSVGAFGFQVTCGDLAYEWGMFSDPTGRRSCSTAHANTASELDLFGGFDGAASRGQGSDARDFAAWWKSATDANVTASDGSVQGLEDGSKVKAVVRVTSIRGTSRTVCSSPIIVDQSPPVAGFAIDVSPSDSSAFARAGRDVDEELDDIDASDAS